VRLLVLLINLILIVFNESFKDQGVVFYVEVLSFLKGYV